MEEGCMHAKTHAVEVWVDTDAELECSLSIWNVKNLISP